jgi:hypothetical protein
MPDKFVFVKELKTGRSEKTNSTWPEITDQDNEIWRLFRQQIQIELNKSYLITFTTNEKGFKDIEKITPLVNIFKQEALKEIASRNDIQRTYLTCLSYSKDLCAAGVTKFEGILDDTQWFYDWIDKSVNAEMAEIQTPKQDIK